MKIISVETLLLEHTLSRPTGPASVLNQFRRNLLVRMTTDDGLVGWGETAPLAGVRETIDASLAPLLVGRDPRAIGRSWRTRWLAPFENGLAVGAVDIALHDLAGQALGVPVHQLYGGARRDRVPVYASGGTYYEGVHPAEVWPAETRDLVARGFRAIKLRMGRYDPRSELDALAAVRAALPRDIKLMVDAWGSYTLSTALMVGRELERLGLTFFEEPLPQFGYRGYEQLAAQLDIAVAGGEMLQNRQAFKELFDRRAVDIVQPDASLCGGIREVLFIAELGELYGIQCIPHSWSGAILNAASIHIASLIAEPTLMPGVGTPMVEFDVTENPFASGLIRAPLPIVDGCFEVPNTPGLGLDVNLEAIRAMEVPRTR
ncbi:MAG: mandelate racemase/muconate lactonizing enzyme family protein [Opitutus sp.]|nr:mandelate racemase/muconate lactonizing enzyme family protein [Opitutus sp.]